MKFKKKIDNLTKETLFGLLEFNEIFDPSYFDINHDDCNIEVISND
ncbi:hypothetical protein [Mesoplasma florum]|nr:hypothetical protein [Mesoplasma florum]